MIPVHSVPPSEGNDSMNVQFATNLRCGACVQKIAPRFDQAAGVDSWKADTDDPRKILSVELSDGTSPDRVVELMQAAGYTAQRLTDSDLSSSAPVSIGLPSKPASSSFSLKSYKPLFLVVAYVVGGTVVLAFAANDPSIRNGMRNFMGLFFLGFAFFKLLDVSKFADAFATYDIIAKRSRAYGLAYPFIELGLGVMFITGTWLFAANVVTAIVMAIGLVGVVSAVRRKQTIQCACLGTAFNLPMSVVTIVENTVMLVMAIFMLL